jgi:hypothetical protein
MIGRTYVLRGRCAVLCGGGVRCAAAVRHGDAVRSCIMYGVGSLVASGVGRARIY